MSWSRPAAEAAAYGAAIALVLGSQYMLWPWAIDDSAISLAYAQNIAEGLGPVSYPGGPPTEGYSNPLWVAMLVPFLWMGFEPFPTVRALGLLLSIGGVFATAAAARPSLGRRGAALAAIAFAAYAPMNIWAQSGLENALHALLVALGVWRLQEDGDRPWAALCFLGLTLTRPEAGALAALAFVASVLSAVPTGQAAARAWGWVRWALIPLIGYQLLRYGVFAAELPAPAYVKVSEVADGSSFHAKTWKYLRRFAVEAGFVVWLPAMFFAMAGPSQARLSRLTRPVAGTLSLLLAAGVTARVFGVLSDEVALSATVATAALVCAMGIAQGGVRAILTSFVAFTLAFSLLTGGDWMKGWRWFSLISVPVAFGVAAFLEDAWRRLPTRVAPWGVGGVLLAFVGHQASALMWVADAPGVSPWSINRRVNHYVELIHTLQLRRRPLVVDQDMGANLLWGGRHYDVRDAKGLTDLPLGLHLPRTRAVDALLAEDVFEKPAFVHLHVVTKRSLGHRRWFREEYVEVPGYAVGPEGFHVAQHVRRDVVMGGEWKGKRRYVHFAGLDVVGWQTRAPEVSAGAGLFFEVAVTLTEPAEGAVDLLLTARGPEGAVASWSLPMGHNLYPPTEWTPGELFVGRYPLRLPRGLPEGSYDLSIAVLHAGTVRFPVASSPPMGPGRADVRLGSGMRIVSTTEMRAEADADLEILEQKAKKRACFSAEMAWEDALAHRIRSRDWQATREPHARMRIAECWANRGGKKAERLRHTEPDMPEGEDGTPDDYLKTAAWEIQRGRTWDPTSERILINGRRVANQLEARSRTFTAAGRDDEAFEALALAARVDPSRPFLRRRVERWRARRLGLDDRLGPLPP